MTDQKPDSGDNNLSTDNEATPPDLEEAETASEQPEEAETESPADEAEDAPTEEDAPAEEADAVDGEATEADADASAEQESPGVIAETEAEAADAAAAGAAWTTTPVAPDPEATEAALAALAAKPEVTLEPPESPPMPPPGDEPPDEGTPVLLVGGILVGAFIVALAIVLILFRPFDNLNDVDASLSPSPVVTEVPSESPSAIATVGTPDFSGMLLEEAETTATDSGLVVRVNPVETDEEEPGTVLDQDPAAGEPVEEGSTVELAVARAVPTNSVPDVSGLSEEDATSELENAGFVVGEITEEFSDEVETGTVISTDPAIDSELPQGSEVDLVVSAGPEFVPVPDIIDLSEADALDALDEAGLAAGAMTEASDGTIVAGNVISSDPAADTEVAPGTEVAYVLSTGPELTAVPDIIDLSEADALDALDEAGLAAGAMTEASDGTIVAGNVISSDPAADTEVAPGTEVAYVLSTGPELTAVPDIIDLSEADALDALDEAGLAAGAMTEASDGTIVAGNVISSDPAADTEVAPGTEVAYVLSTGPELTAVPDIIDLSEADALDALDEAGLAAGAMTEASDGTIVAGNVISSDPAADTEVAPGTEVAYVLSTGPELTAVPDLSGAAADAADAITAAGLTVGDTTQAFSDTVAAGDVINQNPAAGAEVELGTAVSYIESLGVEQMEVPDLSGASADVETKLADADLTVGDTTQAFSDTVAAGDVINQNPAAGTEVAVGSAVDYVVSLGVETVPVPDLSGAAADAADAITAAGLTVGDTTQAFSDTVAAGDVINQNPAAGAEVELGTAVSYIESLGVEQMEVPDLSGASADVETKLADADLTVGDTTQAFSDTVAAGDVINQNPAAGTEVAVGSAVDYVVSLGVETVPVPDLSGAAADAADAITAAGLTVGDTTQVYSDTVAAGDVINQNPAAGAEVELGTTVSYIESLGVEQVEVPDVREQSEADATTAIEATGLTVGEVLERTNANVPAGAAVKTEPAAGEMVDAGSAVTLTMSMGPKQVDVPDVVGMTEADATTAIEAADLTVGDTTQAFSDTVAAGDVINQNPAAGTEVAVGSAVDYVVSLGVETVPVPDLSGAAADAADAITAAGLTVGDTTQVYSDTVAAGDVINQNPAAGAEVELGTAVSYIESLGVEQVEVPDVREQSEADATTAIEATGLTVGEVLERTNANVPAGAAVKTEPAAGEMVDAGSAVTLTMSMGPKQVDVPDVVGMTEADATTAIEAADLTVGDTTQAFSDTVAAGDVINQNPAAGTEVAVGSAVDYVVSLGVETVPVPDLSGAAADAADAITAAGLTVGDTTQVYSDTVAAGDVINQNPAAGAEVELGTAVSYIESLGVEQVEVPDVREQSEADATTAIEATGLTVGEVLERTNANVPAGAAVKTEPAAGEMVDAGSAVTLTMSMGPKQVDVPDVVGMTEADATTAIEAADLTVGDTTQAFSDTVAAGDVINQNPAAGTEVAVGSAVDYVVSLGVETVPVPDLSGAAADAADAITAAGLTVGDTTQVYSDTVAAGDVINQNPAAGAEVELGTTVSYIESLGVEQVEVPDVREQSEADATTAIEATGLTVGEVLERTNANVPAGAAVKTEPAAGEMVDAGSAVTLTMSMGPKQVDVPDVVGMTEADATTAIEAADLTVGASSEENSDTIPAGSTISTSPAAGTTVDAKSSVDYVLSLGIEQVTVPDVVDTAEADAIAAIGAAGLVAGTVTNAFDETIAAGNVVSQDPASGSDADKGSTVDYLVSDGPTPFVRVPAVRDLSEADATAAIEAAELTVGETITQTHEKVAAGNAIKTDPAEGEELLLGSSVVLYVSTGSNLRIVPDVSGQPAAEAQAALEAEDLAVTSDERTNAKVEKGNTVKTEPAAGTEVAVGDEVTLVVSKGPKQVVVPDVVGIPRAEARTNIADAELKVGDETVVEDAAPVNTVIAQEPVPGGETDKNSTVDITVSSGPSQVVIPNIKNIPAAEAQAALEAEGLTVSTQERNNAAVEAGNAVKTAPVAGAPVDAGSEVLLTISKGPKPAVVPDVVGSKKGAAATAITDAGLVVGAEEMVDDSAPSNTVIAQDPPAGSETPTGSSVNLTLSSGPPSVEIPAVKDTPAADAQATLEGLGLVVTTQERSNATVEAGSAVKTEPAAGEVVELGSEVLLTISKGPKPAVVPDVVGSKKGAAATAITDAGLVVGAEEMVEDGAPSNTVIGQDPAATSEVPAGSSVNLTISSGPPSVEIPAVKNTPAIEAQGALEGLGLVVETVERSNASVAAGDAVKTEPAAGELADVGSTVTLTVSKGPKQIAVPSIVGLKKGAANSAITDAGLKVGETTTVEDLAAANTVIAQDPAADSTVDQNSLVNYTISSGPPLVEIPAVKNESEARAVNALEGLGLVVETEQRSNATVAAGDAVKTDPAAGEMAAVGSTVTLTISKGPKQVTVPNIVGLSEADAQASITGAELTVGARAEADDASPAGTVVDQSPAEGSSLDKNSTVDYTISRGPVIEPLGVGGDLASPEVSSQLDLIAAELEPVRELELGNTPYDGSGERQQLLALAERVGILHDAGALKPEEKALKRLGLLDDGDDLAALLETLYGQALPVAYFEDEGHISVVEPNDNLDASERAEAAREFDRALADQQFGISNTRLSDKSRGDEALAGYALEQGDGTAAMLEWSSIHGDAGKTNDVIVPGDDGIYASMPLLLQREYSFPFLEGRNFVDRLRESGGWGSVNDAWNRPPESTEQILHPKLYPGERPTTVVMDGIAGRLGNGWKENWQQTMGELRTGVWLANGQPGEQSGPKAVVKLPRANAAAGWGGDRLVSLDGPDGQWAIVWQTKWDSQQDVEQFANAANAVIADLDGAGLVASADVSSGVSNPVLVLIASSDDTLASVAGALGVAVAVPS